VSECEAVLYPGDLPRGEADAVAGTKDRQASRIRSALVDQGVLVSDSPHHPLRLAFPAVLAPRWLPELSAERSRRAKHFL
jgi:hypothetical protein